MTKPKPRCLGCGGRTGRVRKTSLPICPACKATPEIMHAIRYRRSLEIEKAHIDAAAERDTSNLPRKDSYIPLTGEALVLKMMRGEW